MPLNYKALGHLTYNHVKMNKVSLNSLNDMQKDESDTPFNLGPCDIMCQGVTSYILRFQNVHCQAPVLIFF